MKILLLLLSLVIITFDVDARRISDPLLHMGDESSTDNVIRADIGAATSEPEIRYNVTLKRWQKCDEDQACQNMGGADLQQVTYVAKNGNDAIADGSPDKPYLTIQAAITAITDATAGKKYSLLISPGLYSEDLVLKPYINLIGAGNESVTISTPTAAGISLASGGRVQLRNLTIAGSVGGIDIDATGFTGTVLDMENVFVTNTAGVSFVANGGNDYFQIELCTINGPLYLAGANMNLNQATMVGGTTIDTAGDTNNAYGFRNFFSAQGSYFYGLVIQDTQDTKTIGQLLYSTVEGTVTFTGDAVVANSIFMYIDSVSWPSNNATLSQSGNVVLNRNTPIEALSYDNTTSGLTATQAQAAIDEIEARLDTAESSNTLADVVVDPVYQIGSPVLIDNFREIFDLWYSSGPVDGFDITDNGDGTVDIGAGTAYLRDTADPATSNIYHVQKAAQAGLALADNSVNYIYLDWNAGTPTFAAGTSINDFNCMDKCIAYRVTRSGNDLNILDARKQNVDANRKIRKRFLEVETFTHAEGGSILGESGTRNISVTAGAFYFMLVKQAHPAFDTSVAGTANENVFSYFYRDGGGGFTEVADSKQIDNANYDDGSGTLATLSNNQYRTDHVYIIHNNPSSLAVVYGRASHNSLVDAQAEDPPSTLPVFLAEAGTLIGRVIVLEGDTSLTEVTSSFVDALGGGGGSGVSNHNDLSGLQGGTTSEYYHLTSAQHTNLTGADTSLTSLTLSNLLTLTEIATPATPATGEAQIYPKADGKLYFQNDAGDEYAVLDGGGGLPTMSKGSIITSDGVNNGEFTACADGEIVVWDSTEAAGIKCLPRSRHIGSIQWNSTASCSWSITNQTSFGRFGDDADCDDAARTVSGELTDHSAGLKPEVTIQNARTDGVYRVAYDAAFGITDSEFCMWRLSYESGTNTNVVRISEASSGFANAYTTHMEWTVRFATTGNKQVDLQVRSLGADGCFLAADADFQNLKITVDFIAD